ncbi:MAG: type II toxin-antitoxin system VapC family toxin [Planctomycetales bacterium]
MTPVLLDTGCIVAFLDRSAQDHNHCAEVVENLDAPLITCEAVIAESCYLLRNLRGASAAVLENLAAGVFLIPYRIEGNSGTVLKLMRKYADVPMDFADACLVHMAECFKTARILTLDSDFRIYRWGRNRPFELLIET